MFDPIIGLLMVVSPLVALFLMIIFAKETDVLFLAGIALLFAVVQMYLVSDMSAKVLVLEAKIRALEYRNKLADESQMREVERILKK